jgi:hypothetical protein
MVMKPLEDFKSPIDGQIITSRAKLSEHNRKHGVTNAGDYNNGYVERQAHKRIDAGQKVLKDTRVRDVTKLIDRVIDRNT